MSTKVNIVGASAPVWANAEKTAINLKVRFSHFPQPIPFTASAGDKEEHGRELFSRAKFGEFGKIGEFVGMSQTEQDTLLFPKRKKAELDKVEARITILSRAQKLEMSTKEEDAELLKLERYSIELMRATGPTLPVMK